MDDKIILALGLLSELTWFVTRSQLVIFFSTWLLFV